MKKRGHIRNLLAVVIFAVIFISSAVPALSHTQVMNDAFTDMYSNHNAYENPDADPYKGYFVLNVTNNTNVDWNDFHFQLGDIPGFPSSDVYFDSSVAPTGSIAPSPGGTFVSMGSALSWTISADLKTLDLFFESAPVASGAVAHFEVYTNNTINMNPYMISYWPTITGGTGINGVVPEPVSSTLFLIGAASLGARRYWKKRRAA